MSFPRRLWLTRIMSTMLTAGTTAPELESVVDQDGNPVRLVDLGGRWVLLWWYPMADTPG
jgi:peroxiredoxin